MEIKLAEQFYNVLKVIQVFHSFQFLLNLIAKLFYKFISNF